MSVRAHGHMRLPTLSASKAWPPSTAPEHDAAVGAAAHEAVAAANEPQRRHRAVMLVQRVQQLPAGGRIKHVDQAVAAARRGPAAASRRRSCIVDAQHLSVVRLGNAQQLQAGGIVHAQVAVLVADAQLPAVGARGDAAQLHA